MLKLSITLVACSLMFTNATHGMFRQVTKSFLTLKSNSNFARSMSTRYPDKVSLCRERIKYLRNEMDHEYWWFHIDGPSEWGNPEASAKYHYKIMAQLKKKLDQERTKLKQLEKADEKKN